MPDHLATEFTPAEVAEFQNQFALFDANGDGSISSGELSTVLTNLGQTVSAQRLTVMISEVDGDNSGSIEFGEFVQMMHGIRSGGSSADFGGVVKEAAAVYQVTGKAGTTGTHSFSEDEKIAFSEHVNNCLSHDEDLAGRLPMDINTMALFEECKDGMVFCKLINMAVPDTVDERALNTKKLNVFKMTENQNLAINAAKAIGCQVSCIGALDLVQGNEILILGIIWQIIKIQLLSQINLTAFPELCLLLDEGEEIEQLLKLPPERILIRWVNHHLERAGSERRVNNYGSDFADGEVYNILLSRLDPQQCPMTTSTDPMTRAQHAIDGAHRLGEGGIETFIRAEDIVSGNKKLNMGFIAQLFNANPNLNAEEEGVDLEQYDMAALVEEEDAGDTREERQFRMWINSLDVEGLYITNLFQDCQDGVALLQLMDKVEPGCVNWKNVNRPPKNRFKKLENGNYAVRVAREIGLNIVNIDGSDIVAGNKKLILAIIWQLMRKYTLAILEELGGGRRIEDAQIVAWANGKVEAAGRTTRMNSFRDTSTSNSLFFLDLCFAVEPRAVNWEIVTPGETDEDKTLNAKYAISVARRVGACVFLVPDDILEVKSKMLMTFVAALWHQSLQMPEVDPELYTSCLQSADEEKEG